MKIEKIGRILTLFFLAILPWSVAFAVFGTEVLHLNVVRYFKEIFLVLIGILYVNDIIQRKVQITIDTIDKAIIIFIGILLLVSLMNITSLTSLVNGTFIKSVVYGLRYDAGFLVAFMLFRRVFPLWDITFQDIAKVFLISGGGMLFVGLLIRYALDESILTVLGFSGAVSVWEAGGPPPIYHGIPGASVIRFQGMLEGPNQMAFFLILYIGVYLSVFAKWRKYFFMNGLVVGLLLLLLMQTYSRSGYVGIFLGSSYVIGYTLLQAFRHGNILKKYKITLGKIITATIVVCSLFIIVLLQFGNRFAPIFERQGSTSGHFERMYIGLLRFRDHPLGQGLAQSGPASRSVFSVNQDPILSPPEDTSILHVVDILKQKNPDFIFDTETYYIPESWYIQQMIEGGILGIILFLSILSLILLKIKDYKYIFGATLGILFMNLVLHSFESVHTAMVWSMIIAAVITVSHMSSSKQTL